MKPCRDQIKEQTPTPKVERGRQTHQSGTFWKTHISTKPSKVGHSQSHFIQVPYYKCVVHLTQGTSWCIVSGSTWCLPSSLSLSPPPSPQKGNNSGFSSNTQVGHNCKVAHLDQHLFPWPTCMYYTKIMVVFCDTYTWILMKMIQCWFIIVSWKCSPKMQLYILSNWALEGL
jgi:hypothetical protein